MHLGKALAVTRSSGIADYMVEEETRDTSWAPSREAPHDSGRCYPLDLLGHLLAYPVDTIGVGAYNHRPFLTK
jgi:hypothetical protein